VEQNTADDDEAETEDPIEVSNTGPAQKACTSSRENTASTEPRSKSVEAAGVLAVDLNSNIEFDIAAMPADDDDQGALSEALAHVQPSRNGGSTDTQHSLNVSGGANNGDDDTWTEASEGESNEPDGRLAEGQEELHERSRSGKRTSSEREYSASRSSSENEGDEQPPVKRSRTSDGTVTDGEKSAGEEEATEAGSEDDGESQIPAFPSKQTSRHQEKPAPAKVDSPQIDDSDSEPDFTIPEKSSKANDTSSSNKKTAPPERTSPQEDDSQSEEESAATTRSTNTSRNSKPSSSSNKKTPSRGRITKTPGKGTAKSTAKKTSAGGSGSPSSTPTSSGRPPNKVLFSSSTLTTANKTWLKRQINVVDEIPGKKTNYAVVVRGQSIPTTIKVLRALIAGKRIVTDQWVLDSKKEGDLLDTEEYVHPDLDDDVATDARRTLFSRKTLFFTRFAETEYGDGWSDVKKAAMEAGALAVERGAAFKGAEEQYDKDNVIFFGVEHDTDADELRAKPYERIVYDKKMFAQAIIRGKLELDDDEFVLE
jgi:hypothetical protein